MVDEDRERIGGVTLPAAPPERRGRQRWLARTALLLVALAVVRILVAAYETDVRFLVAGVVAVVVVVASLYVFLAHRGVLRLVAAVLVVATPVALVWGFVANGQLGVVVTVLVLLGVAGLTGRAALDTGAATAMPEHRAPVPQHPWIVMNPWSGGGKVGRFDLPAKAEALGAEVTLLDGEQDVVTLAQDAVRRGADLLGAAGGDGTQALVAGVAVEHDLPFLVVSAGTRNHFALDLGLDREDPAACLGGLTDDAVELHVDLGMVEDRPFVNNASFGAYAAVVQSPAYRADKARTTLDLLPDLLTGHTGPHLTASADGLVLESPQAVLVSDNPYGLGDIAGMGRRARLDGGRLGLVALKVDNAAQAVGLLRRTSNRGVTATVVPDVVVDADVDSIPVGIDGEAVVLPTPVHCTIRAGALRVRVPRDRPGVPRRHARWNWARLWRLAGPARREGEADDSDAAVA